MYINIIGDELCVHVKNLTGAHTSMCVLVCARPGGPHQHVRAGVCAPFGFVPRHANRLSVYVLCEHQGCLLCVNGLQMMCVS